MIANSYHISDLQWVALKRAAARSVDEVRQDLAFAVDAPGMKDYEPLNYLQGSLPRRYMARYDSAFLHKFELAVVMAGWKITDPHGRYALGSVAEELAAWFIIRNAKAEIEMAVDSGDLDLPEEDLNKALDFSALESHGFEDHDQLWLFDDSMDGIEDPSNAINQTMGVANLDFDSWFDSFKGSGSTHPYVDAEPEWGDKVDRLDSDKRDYEEMIDEIEDLDWEKDE